MKNNTKENKKSKSIKKKVTKKVTKKVSKKINKLNTNNKSNIANNKSNIANNNIIKKSMNNKINDKKSINNKSIKKSISKSNKKSIKKINNNSKIKKSVSKKISIKTLIPILKKYQIERLNELSNNSKLTKSQKFLKYMFSTANFPISYYNAARIDNSKIYNNFKQRYRKKFLYPHSDEELTCSDNCEKLFDKSFDYISGLQNQLMNANIPNYIAGGAGLKLYSLYADVPNTEKIYITKDYDIFPYYTEKYEEAKKQGIISNRTIIENTLTLVKSILHIAGTPKYGFLEFYIILNYYSYEDFIDLFNVYINDGYDLYQFEPLHLKEVYIFNFVKLITNEFCIRFKFKFVKIQPLLDEKIYSYHKISFYKIVKKNNNFMVENIYMPVEAIIKNADLNNLNLTKDEIQIGKNNYFIYNSNTLLYNLLHLYYKYHHNTGNIKIPAKIAEGKNIRDEKRLDLFFDIYCKLNYPKLKATKIKTLLKDLKKNSQLFHLGVEYIKDFDMLTNFFK